MFLLLTPSGSRLWRFKYLFPINGPCARRREPISADTIDTMQRRLEAHVFPHIGETDVGQLTGPDLLAVLRRIVSCGPFELAHRVRSICSRVLRYAGPPAASARIQR